MAGIKISLVGKDAAGGLVMGPGISQMTLNGSIVAAVGDSIAPHGPGPHAGAFIVVGISRAKFYGKVPAAAGQPVSCGCVLSGQSVYTF